MYPELQIDSEVDDTKCITGSLLFSISLLNDLKVTYNEKQIILPKLLQERIVFNVDVQLYPDLRRGLTLRLESQWMSHDDKSKLLNALHAEFDEVTDPSSTIYDPSSPILMLTFGFLIYDSASILFDDYKKFCSTEEEFELYRIVQAGALEEKRARENFDCSICMEEKKGNKMIELPCEGHHHLCRSCTKTYFPKMIEEGNIINVRCPECKFEEYDMNTANSFQMLKEKLFRPSIPFEFFEGILTDEVCERYEKLFYEQAAIKLSKHSPHACCICPSCKTWCVKDDLDELMIVCNKCKFAFCFDCLHSWHGYNNRCGKKLKIPLEVIEEYSDLGSDHMVRKRQLEVKYGKRILELEVKEYIADKLFDMAIEQEGSNLQRCPKCRLVIQRSEGCNKMKCAVCGTSFCFICGTVLDPNDPYEHFRETESSCYARLFEGMPGSQDE